MIVVFDSGIWISALRFGGPPLAAIDHAFTYRRIAICNPIVEEIVRIFGRKFSRTRAEVFEALAPYLEESLGVEIPGRVRGVCRDTKDDMILECAMVADAELIVTGDKDLLVLGSYGNVRIVTVRQYLDSNSQET